jgi:hypothetical protein
MALGPSGIAAVQLAHAAQLPFFHPLPPKPASPSHFPIWNELCATFAAQISFSYCYLCPLFFHRIKRL